MKSLRDISVKSSFLKKNCKVFVAMASVLVLFVLGVTIYNVFNSTSNTENTTNANADYLLPADATLETPIMYDFVNGTLGLNETYVDMVQGGKVFFATRDDSNTCYVSYIADSERPDSDINHYLPKFSSEPVAYTFESKAQKDSFFDWLKNGFWLYGELCESEIVKEGDYTFYIADYGDILNGCEKRDDFHFYYIQNNQQPGKMQKAIDGGMGIPTYIIREKCDLEGLKNFSKTTDYTLSFWDTVNPGEQLKCYKKGSTTDYVVISPTLTHETSSSEEWFPTFSINNTVLSPGGSLEHVEKVLEYNGLESLSDTLTRCAYSPTTKGNIDYTYTI